VIPVDVKEFGEKGFWFDYYRYCKPFINDEILITHLADMLIEKKGVYSYQRAGNYELKWE
jgi:hypothetical protein